MGLLNKNPYERIFLHLTENGYKVYPPGVKNAQCTERYIVVKQGVSNRMAGLSSVRSMYNLLLYVPSTPHTEFSQFDDFIDEVKEVMRGLEPMFQPTHFQKAPFYNDITKSYTVSIEYRVTRRIYNGR